MASLCESRGKPLWLPNKYVPNFHILLWRTIHHGGYIKIMSKQDNKEKNPIGVDDLVKVIKVLRGEDGCPWDQKQDPKSIMACLLDESYELADAIGAGDPDHICEELGDVLFQLLFLVELFCEKGAFNMEKVLAVVKEKMIRRHPHIFAGKKVGTIEELYKQWEKIKLEEKGGKKDISILDSIPKGLPALLRAYKVSNKVGRAGFDWNNISEVMKKVEEEWAEFNVALSLKNTDDIALEFGDILFTLTNVARFANIHPETSFLASILKFEKRYKFMEKYLLDNKQTVETATALEIDKLWTKAKENVG
ncbi:MAG: nucleoside triphosphate pyrophosphohydrolase [Desulfobacteraceae bacterium 4572_19]|nr:MAG: nucleoside triphosphate pyrophosphohydrolase [Desulfobacteraceae bacterium 4572_19]